MVTLPFSSRNFSLYVANALDHYDLTLELFELAAKCSQITGDATSLSILSDQIMVKSGCIEDKLNTVLLNISSLAYASKIAESVEKVSASMHLLLIFKG
jgi:hypothetical protein